LCLILLCKDVDGRLELSSTIDLVLYLLLSFDLRLARLSLIFGFGEMSNFRLRNQKFTELESCEGRHFPTLNQKVTFFFFFVDAEFITFLFEVRRLILVLIGIFDPIDASPNNLWLGLAYRISVSLS
jgi:hypothetical protein